MLSDFRLEIPPLIAAACVGITVMFLMFLTRMLLESRRAIRGIRLLRGLLDQLLPLTPETRRQGLTLANLEGIRAAVKDKPSLKRVWQDVELSLEPYRGSDEVEGWFAVSSIGELFSESAIVDRRYHASLHQTVPSILTALGLMTTFVAILIALYDVNVKVQGGAEVVTGIGGLINGLAGKFLSSIIALFLAVTFTLSEKTVEKRLESAYEGLLLKARATIPVLSQFQVLLDIHSLAARRTEMLDRFYSEIAERVIIAARTQMVPGVSEVLAEDLAAAVESKLAPTFDELKERAAQIEQSMGAKASALTEQA